MTARLWLLFVTVSASSVCAAEPVKPVAIGKKVPEFSVKDVQGKTWNLADLQKRDGAKKRRPIVLMFWCSFCDSCRGAEGRLDKLATEYKGKAIVLAIDASAGETAKDVAEVLKENKLSLSVLMDAKGHTADLFDTKVTTTTVVIDSQGVLRYRGQFASRKHAYAKDALKAVLAGKTVRVNHTRMRG